MRQKRIVRLEGQDLTVRQLARRIGIGYWALYKRLQRHDWNVDEALKRTFVKRY